MAAIRFVSMQKTLGYDPAPDASANPVPFQMVPRYGARGMILHNAPKHTLELVPATILPGGSNDITLARSRKTEVGRQKSEDRSRKTEDRSRKTEVGIAPA